MSMVLLAAAALVGAVAAILSELSLQKSTKENRREMRAVESSISDLERALLFPVTHSTGSVFPAEKITFNVYTYSVKDSPFRMGGLKLPPTKAECRAISTSGLDSGRLDRRAYTDVRRNHGKYMDSQLQYPEKADILPSTA